VGVFPHGIKGFRLADGRKGFSGGPTFEWKQGAKRYVSGTYLDVM
jgi:hypothetical protein